MFNTYTAAGGGPETWRPDFQYFGMQFLQVTGLPEGYPVTADLITGLRLMGDTPFAGSVTTSNERINRIHRMAQYSFASNTLSIFTDCPGREKQSYPADYTMVMGAIERNHELASYLRGHMRHLAEGQSMADTFMRGNVALKVPVHDVGFAGQFGDEINWGNGIILVPAFLYELYGDTDTMATYYDEMVLFHDYIVREKAGAGALPDHIVNAALSDWVSVQQTSGQISGTWGYYVMTEKLAMMAGLTGHDEDAAKYAALAEDIKAAFNAQFYNTGLKRYATDGGSGGTTGATQVAQALALDAGLVPELRSRGRPRLPRREHLRLQPVRRRWAAPVGRHHWARPDRPGAHGRWPRRCPLGRAPAGRAAQLRVLPGTDRHEPGRVHDDRRAMEPRRVEEPHDPRPDRGVVPRRPGRHPRGRGLHAVPRAGDQAAARG